VRRAFISSLNPPVVMERTRMNSRPSAKRPPCYGDLSSRVWSHGLWLWLARSAGRDGEHRRAIRRVGLDITYARCSSPNAFSASATAPLSSTVAVCATPTVPCVVNPAQHPTLSQRPYVSMFCRHVHRSPPTGIRFLSSVPAASNRRTLRHRRSVPPQTKLVSMSPVSPGVNPSEGSSAEALKR
jgi:hypothetical protein